MWAKIKGAMPGLYSGFVQCIWMNRWEGPSVIHHEFSIWIMADSPLPVHPPTPQC